MPTIEENRTGWTVYDWSRQGEEWSQTWNGTEHLWHGTLYPRIMEYLPTGTALEIAPGFGRITQFLKNKCQRLIAVDLTSRCIEACRERFRDESHIEFHINDGLSLDMIDDNSIDFAFSFDSLVHAESDVLRSYVQQLGRKLSPTGIGFIHHSNLASCLDPVTTRLPDPLPHGRAASMSALLFREFCREAGVKCLRQEIVNWGGDILHDCFSLFTRVDSPHVCPFSLWENPSFMDEAKAMGAVARHYKSASASRAEPAHAD